MHRAILRRGVVALSLFLSLSRPDAALGHGVDGETTLWTSTASSVCRDRDLCTNTLRASPNGAIHGELSILSPGRPPRIEGSLPSIQFFEARFSRTISVRGARSVAAEATWRFSARSIAAGVGDAWCVVAANTSAEHVVSASGYSLTPEGARPIDSFEGEITVRAAFDGTTGPTKQLTVWTALRCEVSAWTTADVRLELLAPSGLVDLHVTTS